MALSIINHPLTIIRWTCAQPVSAITVYVQPAPSQLAQTSSLAGALLPAALLYVDRGWRPASMMVTKAIARAMVDSY